MKEKDIQKEILKYLRLRKIFCFKVNNVGIKKVDGSYIPVGLKGISDILGIYKGRFLAIEVKKEKGIVSEYQQEFINNVNNNGGIGFVARSLDNVVRLLDK